MKVAVYTISKNEAKQVQPYMESCRDADLVVRSDPRGDKRLACRYSATLIRSRHDTLG